MNLWTPAGEWAEVRYSAQELEHVKPEDSVLVCRRGCGFKVKFVGVPTEDLSKLEPFKGPENRAYIAYTEFGTSLKMEQVVCKRCSLPFRQLRNLAWVRHAA
jgi:hypothetical protein